MTPLEIALRHTRPMSVEEARRDLHGEFAGREMPDPTPETLAEMRELIRQIEQREGLSLPD